MFNNNNNKKSSQTVVESSPGNKADTTIIGSSSNFEGTLKSTGIVRVDGIFSGELNVDGNVIIGENGYIKGNINSNKVTIAGEVQGDVYCSGYLELTSSGRLRGDIEVKNVSIEDGAVFEGKCTMIQPSSSQSNNFKDDNETSDEDEPLVSE